MAAASVHVLTTTLGTEYAAAGWYLTAKVHGVTFRKAFIFRVACEKFRL